VVTLACVEGQPLPFGPEYDGLIRKAADRLALSLRPTLRILREVGGRPTLQGIVGSVRLDSVTTLEIAPKVPVGADWVPAVLDLLIGASRLDVGRDRLAGVSPRRRVLLDLMAAIYAARLQAALRRDGPLLILTRTEARLPVLKGKLQVGRWAREYLIHPTTFPVTFDQLSADNDFSRAMAVVARILANATSESRVSASLLEYARALRPGAPDISVVPAGVIHRPLPTQWAVYRPAWSVAVAVLSQRALLGRHGRLSGVEVVVEAWPLLEELLTRALGAVSVQAHASGRTVVLDPRQATLLTPIAAGQEGRDVQPDGRLSDGSHTLAIFEAKYSPRMSRNWPFRPHVFQALATAAACDSPLAVLVYPESFEPIWWNVEGFHSRPAALAAIGLDLFGYRSGLGDLERGRTILQVLAGPPVASSVVAASMSGAA
jgi:hypothetical protein